MAASSASRPSASARAGMASITSCFGTNSAGSENATGSEFGRRDDHPHPHRRLVEHFRGEIERHAHAAVRGRVAGQRAAVQRDAVPGDAQHVRHPGIVIDARMVILVLLDDGEHAGRRLASRGAGRHRRAQNPAVGVVEGHLLALDRDDGHDRVCRLARRRHLGGVRGGRLLGGGGRPAPSARPWPRAPQWRQVRGNPRREGGWIAPASFDWSFHSSVEAGFPGRSPKINPKALAYGSDSHGLPKAVSVWWLVACGFGPGPSCGAARGIRQRQHLCFGNSSDPCLKRLHEALQKFSCTLVDELAACIE